MRRVVALVIFLIGSSASAWAMEDSQENRLAQALRYVELYDFKAMIAEMMTANATTADERAVASKRMAEMDFDKIKAIYLTAMTQVYTADELAACADFYGTPMGGSILSKQAKFNIAIVPGLKEETDRVFSQP